MKRAKKSATVIRTNLLKKKRAVKQKGKDRKLFYLTALFCVGLFSGAFFYRYFPNEVHIFSADFIQNHLQILQEKSFSQNFFGYLKVEFLLLIFLYFLGFSLFSEGFLWCFPMVQGIGLSLFGACLYSKGGIQGLQCFSFIFLFPSVLSAASYILAVKESILTERDLQKAVYLKDDTKNGKTILKLFSLRYLIFSMGLFLAALLFSILISFFRHFLQINFLS